MLLILPTVDPPYNVGKYLNVSERERHVGFHD
jgi:hypothetical protein